MGYAKTSFWIVGVISLLYRPAAIIFGCWGILFALQFCPLLSVPWGLFQPYCSILGLCRLTIFALYTVKVGLASQKFLLAFLLLHTTHSPNPPAFLRWEPEALRGDFLSFLFLPSVLVKTVERVWMSECVCSGGQFSIVYLCICGSSGFCTGLPVHT